MHAIISEKMYLAALASDSERWFGPATAASISTSYAITATGPRSRRRNARSTLGSSSLASSPTSYWHNRWSSRSTNSPVG